MEPKSSRQWKEQPRWQGVSVLALVASVGIVLGCFLPWQRAQGLFSDPGITNLDGSLALFSALLVGGVALYSLGTRRVPFKSLLFLVVGMANLGVGVMNLRLGPVWATILDVDSSSLVGSGVYVIAASAALMALAGLAGVLRGYSAGAQANTRPSAPREPGTYRTDRPSPTVTNAVSAVRTRRKARGESKGPGVGAVPGLKGSFKRYWHIYICGTASLAIVIEVLIWAFR